MRVFGIDGQRFSGLWVAAIGAAPLAALVFASACGNSSSSSNGPDSGSGAGSGEYSTGSSGSSGSSGTSSAGTSSGSSGASSGTSSTPKDGGADGASVPDASGDAGDAGCGPTKASLTIENYLTWCTVSADGMMDGNGQGATQSFCVDPGAVTLTAQGHTIFVLGPNPWHLTAGDLDGGGELGMVSDAGGTSVSTTTVTVAAGQSKCVWVCCPGDSAHAAETCTTADQCPSH